MAVVFCKGKKLIIAFIIAAAILTRFLFLDARPLHHDEGVNYFFASNILREGKFSYDPINYHGPFYFFSIFLSFLLFGISEFSLRFPAAFFGTLLVLFPLLFKKNFEKFNPALSSLFLLLSPSILYYSRYSIHEISLALWSLSAIYIFSLILEKKDIVFLPTLGVVLGILLSTKETSVLVLAVLALAGLLHFKTLQKFEWKKNFYLVVASGALFFFVYITLYTGFFTDMKGLFESFRGLVPWFKRGFAETGHFKKTSYYLFLILRYELPLLIFGIYGLWRAKKFIFGQMLGLWLVATFFIYSAIKYKMPWIVVNITVPLALLSALGIQELRIKKWLKTATILASALYLAYFSWQTSYVFLWQKVNSFAYVHTNIDALNLVKRATALAQKKKDILIVSNAYWPLPFYLREEKIQYVNPEEFLGYERYQSYDIFIVQDEVLEKTGLLPEFTSEKFTLREGAVLYLVYKP